jgi:uncharacterized paraquat-inducible protein A
MAPIALERQVMKPQQPQHPQVNVQPEYRECFKCSYRGVIGQTTCPNCGKNLYTSENIKSRGIFLIGVGSFLCIFMGAIAALVISFLAEAARNPTNTKRMDPFMLLFIYGIFGIVIVFGANAVATGIWQVIVGRRNRIFIWLMWAILFTLFAAGSILESWQGTSQPS